MADYRKNFIHTTIHDFKTNISRYIRLTEEGQYDGVIIKRYSKPVGLFVPLEETQSGRPVRIKTPRNRD